MIFVQQKKWEEGQQIRRQREEEKKRQERTKKAQEAGIVPKMTDYAVDEQEEMIKLWEEKKAKSKLSDNEKIKTSGAVNGDHESLSNSDNEKSLTPTDVRKGFQAAFNKPGAVKLNREFEEPPSLRNPDQYGDRTSLRYQEGRQGESSRTERKRVVTREVWESKNVDNRIFFTEEYGENAKFVMTPLPKETATLTLR